MNNNVTYLFGAGASYNCLPLVSDMNQRLKLFLDYLDCFFNKKVGFISEKYSRNQLERFKINILKYEDIYFQISKHFTPDTYAKKLYLTDNTEALACLKELLNLYFIFEQEGIDKKNEFFFLDFMNIVPLDSEYSVPEQQDTNYRLLQKINSGVDYRYDVFFSSYLLQDKDSKKLIMPDNVRIISWNYDNQLEFAYNEFSKNEDLREVKSALRINNYNELGESDSTSVLKLNGHSNYFTNKDGSRLTLVEEIKNVIINKGHFNSMSFAWENFKNGNLLDELYKICLSTNILVVIGYSFPNFNREIDSYIINKMVYSSVKEFKIFIQVPYDMEFEKIKLRINMKLEYPLKDDQFFHIKDVDQFFIP